MKLTKENLSIVQYIKAARNKFEEVCEAREENKRDNQIYTILNYGSILKEINAYLEGFVKYKEAGNTKYQGKLYATTVNFYNNMFMDQKKYRRKFRLHEFPDITEQFLVESKRLKEFMESHLHEGSVDDEFRALLELTDNQYRKISKVNRDDMEIYMWLCMRVTFKADKYDIPVRLRVAYKDTTTPVIHMWKPTAEDPGFSR